MAARRSSSSRRAAASVTSQGRFPVLSGLADLQGWPTRNIIAAALAVYIRKRVELPEVGERQDALLRFLWPSVLPRLVGEIDVQNVEDEDVSWMTVPIARGSVFAG